jgi:hypothetical protein
VIPHEFKGEHRFKFALAAALLIACSSGHRDQPVPPPDPPAPTQGERAMYPHHLTTDALRDSAFEHGIPWPSPIDASTYYDGLTIVEQIFLRRVTAHPGTPLGWRAMTLSERGLVTFIGGSEHAILTLKGAVLTRVLQHHKVWEELVVPPPAPGQDEPRGTILKVDEP